MSDNLSLLTTSTSTQIASTQNILDQININVPGVTPIYQQESLTLLFEDGLFLYTWGLKEDALTTLQNVGLQLQPYQDKINISVIGFTDQLERNHLDFPFMRANAVIRYLVDNTQLPEQIFSILPAGNLPPPYPNDSTENQFQNRTVIMIIKPAE